MAWLRAEFHKRSEIPGEHSDARSYSAADAEYGCITCDQQDVELDGSRDFEGARTTDCNDEDELANLLTQGINNEEPEDFSGSGLISPLMNQSPTVSQEWPVTAQEQNLKNVRTCTVMSMN
jgi:hypothetical protein